jgi:hypothetical protein
VILVAAATVVAPTLLAAPPQTPPQVRVDSDVAMAQIRG